MPEFRFGDGLRDAYATVVPAAYGISHPLDPLLTNDQVFARAETFDIDAPFAGMFASIYVDGRYRGTLGGTDFGDQKQILRFSGNLAGNSIRGDWIRCLADLVARAVWLSEQPE